MGFGKTGGGGIKANVQRDFQAVQQAQQQVAQANQAASQAQQMQEANNQAELQRQQQQRVFQQQLQQETTVAQTASQVNPRLSAGGVFGAIASRNQYLGSGNSRNVFLGG